MHTEPPPARADPPVELSPARPTFDLPSSDSTSTLHRNHEEAPLQARFRGLGLDTKARPPWQGASGELEPMTPIAATPAGTGTSHSVSPPSEHRERIQYPDFDPADAYPTPDSLHQGLHKHSKPAIYLRTPESPDFDGQVSVGYDVSPWSTPESRPFRGTTADSTPNRNPSNRRRSFSASPAHRLLAKKRNRYTLATQTTEEDDRTEFEMSSPGTDRPSFDSWRSAASPLNASKTLAPATPLTQSKQAQSSLQPGHSSSKRFSPPRLSRFSWTTQATETTYPSYDGSPQRNFATVAVRAADGVQVAPNPAPTAVDTTPLSPIMSRRRPISSSPHLENHPALSLPNTPTGSAPSVKRKPTPSMLVATPESGEKALPTTPSELSTHDYITSLAARLQALSYQKHNLLKVISSHESVSLGPGVNPLVIDLEKRRKTKEDVKLLQEQLAECRRSEHEIGLRLMRAEKRRDQEGPTALWVRRVTK